MGVNLGYKKRILPLADCPDFFAGHADFSAGHAKNNFGHADFVKGHADFVKGHANFPAGRAENNFGHADFITGHAELFGGHTEFILEQRKTSFRIRFINKNCYFASINQPKKDKMKKMVLLMMVVLVVGSGLMAQSFPTDSAYYKGKLYHFGFAGYNAKGDSIYNSIQIEAEFPGGLQAWGEYLRSNLKSSLGSKYIKIPKGESSAKATVIVTFIINNDGYIDSTMADSLAIATIHPKIIAEAIRVIKECPQWTPAWQNGKNLRYKASQAITFVANKKSFF